MRKAVRTDAAPRAIGPYSQAVSIPGLVFASGQIGLDAAAGALVDGGVEAETRRSLENLRVVLEAAGSGLDRLIRTTVYMTDLGAFDAMNRVYAEFMPDPPPARACVQVSRLPRGACVEIDGIAWVE